MDVVTDELLKAAASHSKGTRRRRFLAEVCERLCDGNARRAEERFGWGRGTIAKGQAERDASPFDPRAKYSLNRGQPRSEEANPQLKVDIRSIVEPHTQSDPELKSERRYTKMSAKAVREALKQRGYTDERLPSERTLRDILNRMNYRLKRIQKAKPLGVLVLATGILALIFGHAETSDFWVDGLKLRRTNARDRFARIRRLAIYLDNGPNNSVVLCFARRMTWKGNAPEVLHLAGQYARGVTVPNSEMKELDRRIFHSAALPKYDITIKPTQPRGR